MRYDSGETESFMNNTWKNWRPTKPRRSESAVGVIRVSFSFVVRGSESRPALHGVIHSRTNSAATIFSNANIDIVLIR